jgi:predicted DNA-binding ribbon-helix-helix protein
MLSGRGCVRLLGRWHITPSVLIEEIKANRKKGTNLSSAIRLFVLEAYQDQITPPEKSKSPITDFISVENIQNP